MSFTSFPVLTSDELGDARPVQLLSAVGSNAESPRSSNSADLQQRRAVAKNGQLHQRSNALQRCPLRCAMTASDFAVMR